MHPLTGDKATVLDTLGKTVQTFQNDGEALRQQMTASLPAASEADRQRARLQILGQLQDAYAAESARPDTPQDQAWYMPRSATVAAVQTAMNQHLGPTVAESQSRGMTDETGAPGPAQFGDTDPLWIEAVVDSLATLIRGKANFVTHQSLTDFLYPVEDQCRMALVGDWGADNEAAENVRHQIQNLGADYVIHLGDIYYAGQDNEAESFLRRWPKAGQKRSFALNGNHEMFSGGHAYFGKVLAAFGQPASYFGLYNAAWQFLAVDTAFVEHRLLSDQDARLTKQFDWLVDKLKDTSRKNILLSHHQPLSAFAADHSAAAGLRGDVGKLTLEAGPFSIFGWFFGHEHRCTIYDDTRTEYRARLIGHGAIPMDIPNGIPDDGCVPFTAINQTPKPDGSGYLTSGFALLTLDGARIAIQYVNEDGGIWQKEQWP